MLIPQQTQDFLPTCELGPKPGMHSQGPLHSANDHAMTQKVIAGIARDSDGFDRGELKRKRAREVLDAAFPHMYTLSQLLHNPKRPYTLIRMPRCIPWMLS